MKKKNVEYRRKKQKIYKEISGDIMRAKNTNKRLK